MRKVLIFGSAGQLGVELVTVFRSAGFEVQPLTRANLDITDASADPYADASVRQRDGARRRKRGNSARSVV
ncbi:MAG TPA: sugar nucleotide-binding protein [Bryobacteraceae bacterium]|nr:sugar nucleotide-binding protein [Bryobacteraceae bacterium]